MYLKIIDILYFREDTNTLIDASYIENVIKTTYIFDSIQIASKPRVVKVLPRSDMVIVISGIHKVVTQKKYLLTVLSI